MDLVVSDESDTYYLSPFLEVARDEGALIATLKYDLTLEICAAAANISLDRIVSSWSRTGSLTKHSSGTWTRLFGPTVRRSGQATFANFVPLV